MVRPDPETGTTREKSPGGRESPDLSSRFAPDFFHGSTLRVCRDLLGCYLVHSSSAGLTAGRIVETEAYLGPHDRGSHSYGGRMTERNRAMFGTKGHAYVYLIYGMYWCFNVVSGPPGKPQAVLVRALEPVAGLDVMRERLGASDAPDATLCRGPGKLCRAMGITRTLNVIDLSGDCLFLVPGKLEKGERVGRSPRVNIDYAGDHALRPWRYYVRGNPCVSGPARNRR
jgi:DNA-3-methyladenine glycosylase